ncbi:MAG: cupin fold metalloprotein, WbuC family [Chloroflexi bacterium]|nr:cupin fold metalloprotein, WbuC family [Chloroflexota bacterium]
MLFRINQELMETLMQEARRNPRKRAVHNLHKGPWEHAHRMVSAITTESYVRPHKHLGPHRSEAFVILKGKAAVVVFDDLGSIDEYQTTVLEVGGPVAGVDIAADTWHGIVVLQDGVLFEVKGQPDEGYVAKDDKVFAAWSPPEGSEAASAYLELLRSAVGNMEA